MDRGRMEEAREKFQQAVKADPKNVDALNNLAILLRRQGDLSGSLSALQRALKLGPESA